MDTEATAVPKPARLSPPNPGPGRPWALLLPHGPRPPAWWPLPGPLPSPSGFPTPISSVSCPSQPVLQSPPPPARPWTSPGLEQSWRQNALLRGFPPPLPVAWVSPRLSAHTASSRKPSQAPGRVGTLCSLSSSRTMPGCDLQTRCSHAGVLEASGLAGSRGNSALWWMYWCHLVGIL